MDPKEAKMIIASNLTVAAMLQQLTWAQKGKATTGDGKSEAINLFKQILAALD